MASVLVLRACNADMTSRNEFVWPTSGYVEAPDWRTNEECGHGLHGWLHGHGEGGTSNYWEADCKWLVVKVDTEHLINLDGKVKFKCGEVVFCGDRKGAINYLTNNSPLALTKPIVGAEITVGVNGSALTGYCGVAISGDSGISVSGDYGKSTTGDYGIATSGNDSTSTSGDHGTSISGEESIATSGYAGTSTIKSYGTAKSGNYGLSRSGIGGISFCGDYGTAISGHCGTSTSGKRGMSTSGHCGTSISGDLGNSIVGADGKATSGEGGNITIKYFQNDEPFFKSSHVGKGGLKPYTAYKLDNDLNFVEVQNNN